MSAYEKMSEKELDQLQTTLFLLYKMAHLSKMKVKFQMDLWKGFIHLRMIFIRKGS